MLLLTITQAVIAINERGESERVSRTSAEVGIASGGGTAVASGEPYPLSSDRPHAVPAGASCDEPCLLPRELRRTAPGAAGGAVEMVQRLRGAQDWWHMATAPTPTPTPDPPTSTPTLRPRPTNVSPTSTPVPAVPRPTTPPAPPVAAGDIAAAICALPWPCQEALDVARHESGMRWVWNTQGSGACGPFQTLPCVGWMDLGAHLAEAYRKWKACNGGSFYCAWYQWWRSDD